MSIFPKIQSPCPYKGDLSDIMDGDTCRLCSKEVVDLTDMTARERRDYVDGAKGEICVSYKVAAGSAIAAMAAAMPSAAAAQDMAEEPAQQSSAQSAQDQQPAPDQETMIYGQTNVIIVGGMRKPGKAEWVEDKPASDQTALPVEYDDAPQKPAPKPAKKA